LEIISIT